MRFPGSRCSALASSWIGEALALAAEGKQAFAARANLLAVALPERSNMRSWLSEMADQARGPRGRWCELPNAQEDA